MDGWIDKIDRWMDGWMDEIRCVRLGGELIHEGCVVKMLLAALESLPRCSRVLQPICMICVCTCVHDLYA